MSLQDAIDAGLRAKYKKERNLARGLDLQLHLVHSRYNHIPDYFIISGKATPPYDLWNDGTTLWYHTDSKKWFVNQDGEWTQIPSRTTHTPSTIRHPNHPSIHLFFHATWKTPRWLPHSGFRRVVGLQRPKDSENRWVQQLVERWEALGKPSAAEDEITGVLGSLLAWEGKIPDFQLLNHTGMFDEGRSPSLESAIASLTAMSSEDQFDRLISVDGRDKNLTLAYFRKLFLSPESCARELAMVDMFAHRIPGPNTLSDRSYNLPFHLRHLGHLGEDKSMAGHPITLPTFLTTRGFVSHPHCDDLYVAGIIVHLHGPKLWLRWPCNEHNRRFMGDHWLSGEMVLCGGSIRKGVEQLTGMRARLIEEPLTSFVLDPSEIHACISFGRSAHMNILLLHPTVFRKAMAIADYFLKVLEDEVARLEQDENSSRYTWLDLANPDIYHGQVDQIVQWWTLLSRSSDGSMEKVREQVKDKAVRLSSLWKRIGKNTQKEILGPNKDVIRSIFLKLAKK